MDQPKKNLNFEEDVEYLIAHSHPLLTLTKCRCPSCFNGIVTRHLQSFASSCLEVIYILAKMQTYYVKIIVYDSMISQTSFICMGEVELRETHVQSKRVLQNEKNKSCPQW